MFITWIFKPPPFKADEFVLEMDTYFKQIYNKFKIVNHIVGDINNNKANSNIV